MNIYLIKYMSTLKLHFQQYGQNLLHNNADVITLKRNGTGVIWLSFYFDSCPYEKHFHFNDHHNLMRVSQW